MNVPIIDLSLDVSLVGEAIGRACKEWGFFYVSNHGVSSELIDSLDATSREFFALPEVIQYAMCN